MVAGPPTTTGRQIKALNPQNPRTVSQLAIGENPPSTVIHARKIIRAPADSRKGQTLSVDDFVATVAGLSQCPESRGKTGSSRPMLRLDCKESRRGLRPKF